MIFRTFKATTFAEVFKQVREVLGPDAVVLHTRTCLTRKWLGLRREMSVEVTVVKQEGLAVLSHLSGWAPQPQHQRPSYSLN